MGVFSSPRAKAAPRTEARSGVPAFASSSTTAGYLVDTSSASTSLQSIAVRSSVDLVASLVSELPLDVYSGRGNDKRERPTPGYLEDPAGDGTGRQDWLYTVLISWLLRGNLYGDVLEWARGGLYPTQIATHYPDDVSGYIDGDGRVQWLVNGRPVNDPSSFLHRRVNPVPGRVLGLSPVAFHAAQIGLSLTSTRFGAQWFQDGGHPGGILANSEDELKEADVERAKQRFMAMLRGNREPVVLGKGWSFEQVQIAPEESQFLETQGFSEAQCARIFGPGLAEILGYETGGSMTYANVVERRSDVLVFSIDKWISRADRLLSAMLPRPQYARLNRDALLRSTTLARYEAHAIALENRFKTVNEVRDDEDLAPVEWGDVPNEPKPAAAAGAARSIELRAEPTPTAPPEVTVNVNEQRASEPPVVNVTVEPTPVTVEVHPTPVTVEAPVVNVAAPVVEVHVDPTPVTVAAPDITVNVEPTPVAVEVAAPAVEVTVDPTPVQVNVETPARKTTTTVERDGRGLITKTTATERDA